MGVVWLFSKVGVGGDVCMGGGGLQNGVATWTASVVIFSECCVAL